MQLKYKTNSHKEQYQFLLLEYGTGNMYHDLPPTVEHALNMLSHTHMGNILVLVVESTILQALYNTYPAHSRCFPRGGKSGRESDRHHYSRILNPEHNTCITITYDKLFLA